MARPKTERQRVLARERNRRYSSKPGFKERRRDYWQQYYTPEKMEAASKRRTKHRQKPEVKKRRIEYQRRYRATDGNARSNAAASKRRIREQQQSLNDVAAAYTRLLAIKRPKCFYCGTLIRRKDRQIDHVKPLCDNGAHAAYNVVLSCANCNRKKNRRHANTFVVGQLVLVF
jgi:5-methylcytosine-specific restriction endonuclease McrA